MRGRGKWLALVVAACSISTGVAIAHGGWSETTQVMGTFEAAPKGKVKQKQCDAKHVRVNVRYKGTQDSNDERLVGDLEIRAESVVNTTNRWGRTEGDIVLRDSDRHHKIKLRGKFVGVVEPDGGVEGFTIGDAKDGTKLFANFNVDENDDQSISGEFGQDSQSDSPYVPEDQDPAILTNACFKKHGHGHGHGR
jgi:hypothetical protein